MGLIERLRDEAALNGGQGAYAWQAREKCGRAADALEKLREYAVHDALCARRQHTANVVIQDCDCGLSALLKEIDGE